MPRYYCDYCDTYLTHDSPSVRKQHNAGYKHKANVRAYYQQFEEQQTQSLIDQKVKEHLGQQAAFQHFAALQSGQYKPPIIPVLPRPGMPLAGSSPASTAPPLTQQIRPPVLPPPGAPMGGYNPSQMPPMFRPPIAPGPVTSSTQPNGVIRPPTLPPPGRPLVLPAGSAPPPTANGTPNPSQGPVGSFQHPVPAPAPAPGPSPAPAPAPAPTAGSYGSYVPTSQPIVLAGTGTLPQPPGMNPSSSSTGFTAQQAPQVTNPPGNQGSFTYGQTPTGQSSVGQATNPSFTSPPGATGGYQS